MPVTSAQLDTAIVELTALRDAIQQRVDDFRAVTLSASTAQALLAQVWRGPLPSRMNTQVGNYVSGVSGVGDAADSARGTVDAWVTAATSALERMKALESRKANAEYQLELSVGLDQGLVDEWATTVDGITEESIAWRRTCQLKGEELQPAITAFQTTSLLEVGTVDERSALLGPGFEFALASWATGMDLDLDLVDPTGRLQAEAKRRLEEFVAGEHADLMYALIETMNQADISKMNGKSSADDWLLSTDPDVVRFRLQIAADLAGIELTDAELDAIAADIVSIGVFGAATDGDIRGWVDDQFDEHAGIEAALDEDGAETERDWELPDNASETDQYVDGWLQAQWQGNPGIFDIAKMLLLPDFAAMNPWSDDFSIGWAIVEVIGIVPVGKIGKLARVGRLFGHADEATGAARLMTDGVEIFSDSRRVGDDVAATGDEILSTTDNAADSANDLPNVGDEAADAGDTADSGNNGADSADGGDEAADGTGDPDDVPTRDLPKTDPRVVAETSAVSDPAMARLQVEVDRIWAETQRALPDASPQQLGTRAHRELEAWIVEHGDELVDPETGYRLRAEVSFGVQADGTIGAVQRGTKGSIRPDVIMERQTADGVWEVVEVADLKTGRAGISTSWQDRVDGWIEPTTTREVHPTPPSVPQ